MTEKEGDCFMKGASMLRWKLFIFAQVLVKAIHDDILTMSFVKEKKRKSYTFSKHIEPHSQTIYVGKKILRKQKST